MNPQLWLHERGHNVGLDHSADRPYSEKAVPPSVGLRLMFWSLAPGHLGKNSTECAAYENAALASVSKLLVAADAPKGYSASLLQENGVSTTASPLSGPSPDDSVKLFEEARKLGLTDAAIKVAALPWEGKAPYDDIKALNKDDINSIHALFKGAPNGFWAQAIQILAIADQEGDLTYIQTALGLPMKDVSPRDNRSDIRMNRITRDIKSVVPAALAIVANRTKSSNASKLLISIADLDNAKKLIGNASAVTLSKSAIAGMFVADTIEVNRFLNDSLGAGIPVGEEQKPDNSPKGSSSGATMQSFKQRLDSKELSELVPEGFLVGKEIKAAPTSKKELEDLRQNHERIHTLGLDAVLKGK
jgi:hypothetical protein